MHTGGRVPNRSKASANSGLFSHQNHGIKGKVIQEHAGEGELSDITVHAAVNSL